MKAALISALCLISLTSSSFAFLSSGFASKNVKMSATTTSVPELLIQTEKLKLLSTASRLGLLSKLERAGLTLRDLEAALPLLDEIDAIALGKELSPQILPLLPKALEAAPALLALAASALEIPPSSLLAIAFGSLLAGGLEVAVIPDDSITAVAIQSFLAIPLLILAPGASFVGALVLSKANDGTLVPFAANLAEKLNIAGPSKNTIKSKSVAVKQQKVFSKTFAAEAAAPEMKLNKAKRSTVVVAERVKPERVTPARSVSRAKAAKATAGNMSNLPKRRTA
mmetsp:Transcript_9199/g.13813  ORF Transcript_9199/g.13813 Transcript_9199/m.13813 type:complete len:283 (-) Transcript_9199:66-914(-)|eukprot:CAMPEP_0171462692 /NCGR_PEP_ID=MMETSP0945-20130129/6623_1 /TAXON_ID=109269 /ORGANISM="Vaucheria litorea, Strain CCMP2940" /LENGTH=282 /DNA_ID=CAMNT_0011989259 /DNA_START=26 /DNA_END=874 /DNA_ORIENTATION=-